jgi:hypothetical protein
MKERDHDFTPFNHGYLCQMLRSANDNELDNIINDVRKEKERRNDAKKEEYLKKIREAITEATDAGYVVAFYQDPFTDVVDYLIDENSEISLDIELE